MVPPEKRLEMALSALHAYVISEYLPWRLLYVWAIAWTESACKPVVVTLFPLPARSPRAEVFFYLTLSSDSLLVRRFRNLPHSLCVF
jgi:hypothetical protein